MSIIFHSEEDLLRHCRDEHDNDAEYLYLAQRFQLDSTREYRHVLEAADLLHAFGYLRTVEATLAFFEKPYNYVGEVWSAACDAAGVSGDECDDCD